MLHRKHLKLILFLTMGAFALSGCCISHSWTPANCTEPMTCTRCGKTEGRALGHIWEYATCTTAKYCPICGETEGEPLGHDWAEATCTEPETCKNCGETRGDALGHEWLDATCESPKTCERCGETEGEPLAHDWIEATHTEPKTCERCGLTEGEALGYKWEDFEDLPAVFWYSNGVGGWATSLELQADGTFTGEYYNTELGENDEKYPNGTVYISNFEGRFSDPEQVDEYTFTFRVESLKTKERVGKEKIKDEIRTVYTEPAGLEDAETFYMYLPETPVEELPEEFLRWAHLEEDCDELPEDCYGLYNPAGETGFIGYNDDASVSKDPTGENDDADKDPTDDDVENWNLSDDEILDAITRYMDAEKDIAIDGTTYTAEIREESGDGFTWVEVQYVKSGRSVAWIGVNRKSAQCVDATYQAIDMIFYLEP